jgi:hypothetical protein
MTINENANNKIGKTTDDKNASNKYIPIIFDFKKDETKSYTEVIKVLGGISRFIIADLSDPSSIPHELQAIIGEFSVPIIPIFHKKNSEVMVYSMFTDYYKYNWVYRVVEYVEEEDLFAYFKDLIDEAESFFGKIKSPKNVKRDIKPINIKDLALSKAKG